jgi:hypothetical protein
MTGADTFAAYLAALQSAQGESVTRDGDTVTQHGWRLMDGIAPADPQRAFASWNALWEGALAAHDRTRTLFTERSGDAIVWRIR